MDIIDYHLVRSRRRTVAIYVLPDATVEVRSPLRMSKKEIDLFVASREKWILSHVALIKERAEKSVNYSAGEGDTVLYKGADYPVRIYDGKEAVLQNDCMLLPETIEERKNALVRFYRFCAKKELPALLQTLSDQTGMAFDRVTIGSARTRWGSCSGKNAIRLSWRLILLPDELIRYVLIHELCHTVYHNHSSDFWRHMGLFLQDYREKRKRLRQFERRHEKELSFLP